jgi:hypothetical protein
MTVRYFPSILQVRFYHPADMAGFWMSNLLQIHLAPFFAAVVRFNAASGKWGEP